MQSPLSAAVDTEAVQQQGCGGPPEENIAVIASYFGNSLIVVHSLSASLQSSFRYTECSGHHICLLLANSDLAVHRELIPPVKCENDFQK